MYARVSFLLRTGHGLAKFACISHLLQELVEFVDEHCSDLLPAEIEDNTRLVYTLAHAVDGCIDSSSLIPSDFFAYSLTWKVCMSIFIGKLLWFDTPTV